MEVPDFMGGSISIPTLLIAAGNDKVVSVRAVEEMGFKMRSGRALVISGAQHELLQERDQYRESNSWPHFTHSFLNQRIVGYATSVPFALVKTLAGGIRRIDRRGCRASGESVIFALDSWGRYVWTPGNHCNLSYISVGALRMSNLPFAIVLPDGSSCWTRKPPD